ncbi:MAG: hypothetical protein WC005_08065 [Candidatus Nanopelagicales bacterium]
MSSSPQAGKCQICVMNPKLTHSANEHQLAEDLVGPFLEHVKTDAFTGGDRPMTYAQVISRFDVDTPVHRTARILDGMEQILGAAGWPDPARAGIAAYVVDKSGKPGGGWLERWKQRPEDARRQARAYVRHLTLDVDV